MSIRVAGGCVCKRLRYSISVKSLDDARTSICHCSSCRAAFGTNFGLTTKIPLESFEYEKGYPKAYQQDSGVNREFCDNCGVFMCEYGEQAADKFRYVMWGTLDDPDKFPPKGEFFCKLRKPWMPPIPGVFHKDEIKE